MSTFKVTRPFLKALEEKINAKDWESIKGQISQLHYGDISNILFELAAEDAKQVLQILEHEIGGEVLSDIEEDFRDEVLKHFSSQELATLTDFMDSDDAVDMLKVQDTQLREEVIALLKDRQKAKDIIHLLPFEEDTAGGLMAKEFIKANINWSVKQCIEEIRRQGETVNKIYSIYVVDDKGILVGRVSLKKIILSNDHLKIADIYEQEVIAIKTFRHEDEVVEIMQRYDLEALPVVNVMGKLLGRITIDDVVDVMAEQQEQERQAMTGISSDVEEDDNVFKISKARLPWLVIGMAGGIMGAQFIGVFEKDLIALPAMAFFIPLITATGGNVGIQSSSIVIQSLANKLLFTGAFQRLLKVLVVALLNGFVLALIVLFSNLALGNSLQLSIIVAIALFFVVLFASFTGTITPLVLNKLKINPAFASGPFITTANDLLGLAVYFMTARFVDTLF